MNEPVATSREERIAELSEQWEAQAQALGFSHAESVTAATHLLYMLLCDSQSMDKAAAQLSDMFITTMQAILRRKDWRDNGQPRS
jgi:hypothetical protein